MNKKKIAVSVERMRICAMKDCKNSVQSCIFTQTLCCSVGPMVKKKMKTEDKTFEYLDVVCLLVVHLIYGFH
jgi:hypothetical protein